MRNHLVCLAALSFAAATTSLAAPDKEAIISKENAVWNAFSNRNADEVKKLVSTDVVTVYPDGIYNFQQKIGFDVEDRDEIVFTERF